MRTLAAESRPRVRRRRMNRRRTHQRRIHQSGINRRRQLRRRIAVSVTGILLVIVAVAFAVTRNGKVTPALLASQGYPEDLVELMERNPETKQFVLDYPQHTDGSGSIDITGDVTLGKIPLFLQWDERWGYKIYGSSFLAVTGCGPTCLSMVYCGLTGNTDWNPYQVACMAEESGYYVDGVGTAWSLMEDGARKLGITPYSLTVDAEEIRNYLELGMPVIASMGPGDFTSSGHFIVLKGIGDDGKVQVADPNSRKNSEKTWEMDRLVGQMSGAWAYGV